MAKKHKKQALGRGLSALLHNSSSDISSASDKNADKIVGSIVEIDLNTIKVNPFQPRTYFNEESLKELAVSIEELGIIQPITVRKLAGNNFQLVAGERRYRASKLLGLKTIPAYVRIANDQEMLEMALVENIQREDLNAMEEAEAYHHLMIEFNLTQDQVALRVGKSRSTIANCLRLRQLPEEIKSSIMDNSLSMGHARALLGAGTTAQQRAAWRAVVSKGLSVRETETLVKRLKADMIKPKKSKPGSEEIYLINLAEDLSRRLGAKVQIKKHGQKGKVVIDFYTNDDLDRLISLFATVHG